MTWSFTLALQRWQTIYCSIICQVYLPFNEQKGASWSRKCWIKYTTTSEAKCNWKQLSLGQDGEEVASLNLYFVQCIESTQWKARKSTWAILYQPQPSQFIFVSAVCIHLVPFVLISRTRRTKKWIFNAFTLVLQLIHSKWNINCNSKCIEGENSPLNPHLLPLCSKAKTHGGEKLLNLSRSPLAMNGDENL